MKTNNSEPAPDNSVFSLQNKDFQSEGVRSIINEGMSVYKLAKKKEEWLTNLMWNFKRQWPTNYKFKIEDIFDAEGAEAERHQNFA
jgi:hypothetical protein